MAQVCETCGSTVSDRFAAVMYPDPDEIPICPNCDDVSSTKFADELMRYYVGDRMSPGL